MTVQFSPGESTLVRKHSYSLTSNYLFYADENKVKILKPQFTILQLCAWVSRISKLLADQAENDSNDKNYLSKLL